jgi:hypothetical protein
MGWRSSRRERCGGVRLLVRRGSGGGQAAEFSQERFVKLVREGLSGRPVGADEHRDECGFDVVSACSRRLVVSSAASASGGSEGCHQCGEGLGHSAHAAQPLGAPVAVGAQVGRRPIV